MKKIILSYLLAGIVLLVLSFGILELSVYLFPRLSDEYYSPMFASGGGRRVLFFIHPFILAIALKYFWQRFKGGFRGNFFERGLELGIVYALIATLPAMWIMFSAMKISFEMVISWFIYGFIQASVAGIIYAKTNP